MNAEEIKKIHAEIIEWIKNWFADKGNAPAVIGVSGGKDSTVCAALLTEALGKERVIPVLMPNGEQKDISDSREVCRILGLNPVEINIGKAYNAITEEIKEKAGVAEFKPLYTTNTPARLRMVTLYGIAAQNGGFVCNTCNLSEDYIGYSTKWGDAAGDFSLLCRLTKTEVCQLGDELNLPEHLVHKVPSDGMCGKSDEDNLGFTYADLDKFIRNKEYQLSPETKAKVERMHNHPNTKKKCIVLESPLEWLPAAF